VTEHGDVIRAVGVLVLGPMPMAVVAAGQFGFGEFEPDKARNKETLDVV